MMLRQIVVVDDEAIQRNTLSKILQKITPESEITACANGLEAYEYMREHQTDLLITDISMPVMDGMQLIEKVYAEFSRIKIVLISAYQEFEYAQKAIQCGVTDYLIKPFRVEDARKLIERIEEKLKKEQEKDQRLNQYDRMVENSLKKEHEKKLYHLINGSIKAEQMTENERSVLRGKGVISIVRWRTEQKMVHKDVGLRASQQKQLLDRLEFVFSDADFVMLENGLNKKERKMAILLSGWTSVEAAYELRQILKSMERESVIFWAGISNSKQNLLEDAADAFNQAEEALSFYFYTPHAGEVFEYSEYNDVIQLPMVSISQYEKKIRQFVYRGGVQAAGSILKELENLLIAESRVYPGKMKHRVSSMVVSVMRELEGTITQAEYDSLLNDAYQLFGECDSAQQLFAISGQFLEKTMAYFIESKETLDVVESAIAYIKTHLDENISLQSLADQYHFHPNYLSAQIKSRTGESCVNYILSLRMEEARRLLTETSLRVVEIAAKCGFNDSSYFNRVFRKKYQLSPEQYRKVHKTC